ncbi:MAG TPA: phospholipid-binding protein [Alphaproteobacteria bacterium]|nr:phospholipid-binding protein [Alphaproteobacteria bacterium]
MAKQLVLPALALALALLGAHPLLAQPMGFSVDFSWEGTAACFDPKSPAFSLSNVPPGTTMLAFTLQDLDAPSFPHGGGSVAYRGQAQVPRGSFTYKGPCPPSGQHSYQWTVKAVDASGKTLAVAQTMKKFPPK